MISDTLFEARREIQKYLDGPVFAGVYGPRTRAEIADVTTRMEQLQTLLDTEPNIETFLASRPERKS